MAKHREYATREGFKLRVTARLKNAELIGAREILGLTIKELAEQIGIPYQVYCQYENMILYPSEERQKYICGFFRQGGVFLFEDDVFPEELRRVKPKRAYVAERTIPKERLLPLSKVEERLLPVVESEAEKVTELSLLRDKLEEVLKTLYYREREIIKMRFGLYDGRQYTLEELSKIFNVNPQRIRQIEAKAIRKLQHPIRSEKLEEFVEVSFPAF